MENLSELVHPLQKPIEIMASYGSVLFWALLVSQLVSGEQTYSLSVPTKIQALKGSCLQIPCTFNVSDFENKVKDSSYISVVWIRNKSQFKDNPPVFNSSQNTVRGFEKIELLGDPRKKNGTTVFYNLQTNHSDNYYFRIEIGDEFRATFPNNPVEVEVKDSPSPPQISGNYQVRERSPVTLTCTAAAPCPSQPPTITWTPSQKNPRTELIENLDKTTSVLSKLSFTASYTDHLKKFICKGSYPIGDKKYQMSQNSSLYTLRVLFSPKEIKATIQPLIDPIPEGTLVTLTCSCKANPDVRNYTWYRNYQKISESHILTFNMTARDEGRYQCRAENHVGESKSTTLQLKIEGSGSPTKVVAIVIGCLLSLLLCVLTISIVGWNKRKVSARSQETSQCQTAAVDAEYGSVKTKEEQPAEIHYGEIDFSKWQPNKSSMEDNGSDPGQVQTQETVYAEVRKLHTGH
ncbi:sialic acid-binding Ig-like lectin 13 [Denticeps clupeoides]|uniref:Si:dkeyp-28d2.4 n=1 Tax=Denticeps clupeoides TaxID=299321 RepID=A0AAY4BA52_9TELE|nr:sialic acid-binding Ig-like lectin 13 [Denticeps clupeoides]XP_028825172.1 sialic acid-binding Ig-like lectin 13 [Denticeps clupeoides]